MAGKTGPPPKKIGQSKTIDPKTCPVSEKMERGIGTYTHENTNGGYHARIERFRQIQAMTGKQEH